MILYIVDMITQAIRDKSYKPITISKGDRYLVTNGQQELKYCCKSCSSLLKTVLAYDIYNLQKCVLCNVYLEFESLKAKDSGANFKHYNNVLDKIDNFSVDERFHICRRIFIEIRHLLKEENTSLAKELIYKLAVNLAPEIPWVSFL